MTSKVVGDFFAPDCFTIDYFVTDYFNITVYLTPLASQLTSIYLLV